MTNLNTIIEISNLCKKNNIEVRIDGSGILLSTYKEGNVISKHYDLEILNKIVDNLPLEIIVDLFLEEMVLKFRKAVN